MSKISKITINEIAILAQTSKTTISFYLNGHFEKMSDATKKRIDQVIKDTGYTPSIAARSLNSKQMNLIGVLIGDITNNFSNQMVKGIELEAQKKGYQLIMANSNYNNYDEKRHIENMLAMGVDGFIVQPTNYFEPLIDRIKQNNKQLVFIDSNLNNSEMSVKANTYEACKKMISKLKGVGYEEVLMISADPSVLSTRLERVEGLKAGCLENKLPCITYIVDEKTEASTLKEEIMKHITLNSKTVVCAMNCWLLPKIFIALKEFRNLIPSTIGLFGFDNTEWTNFSSPSITSIIQPAFEEGQKACALLISSIDGSIEDTPNTIVIDCGLNWADSTDRK